MPESPASGLSDRDQFAIEIERLSGALLALHAADPDLARRLARLSEVVLAEASKTQRFARALKRAIEGPKGEQSVRTDSGGGRRTGRRNPGVLDPFSIYAESGELGLRERLQTLDLDQLRDVVAEHGMDHDRLAMKWKDPQRVMDRIVERVSARAAKGDAFRSSTASSS